MIDGGIIGILNLYIVLIFGISLLVIILLSIFLFNYFSNPFKYPYLYIKFDITKIRNPSMNDLIDNYLIDKRMDDINFHILEIEKWKKECENQINNSIYKKKRK